MNRARPRLRAGRTAFTLLELTLVVGLVAILASSAVLTLRAPIRAARIRAGESTLRLLDTQARQSAINGRSASLWIDLDRQTVERDVDGVLGTPYRVPIREIKLAQQVRSAGRIEISYDPAGASPSFAVHWATLAGDRWSFVCGGSGQFLTLKADDDAANLQLP